MNTLYKSRRISLGHGVFKMPFSLDIPRSKEQIAEKLSSHFSTHHVSKVKMCHACFGWATFVPRVQLVGCEHVVCGDDTMLVPQHPSHTAREEAMYV